MAPQDEIDNKAEEWFNSFIPKLRYSQDYSICFGHSKDLLNEDGSQKGISISRPYVRLFSTGVTKIYRMAVLGEKLEDVEYTPEQEKELDKAVEKAERKHEKMVNNE
jgi:hypothetical protein